LEEAKWGKLTEEELLYVVEQIKASSPGNDDNLYTLIHTLGRSGAIQYQKLVERFLYYPSNPTITSIALRTLCVYWSFAESYKDLLKEFIQGVEWEPRDFLRINAISCAGQLLMTHLDRRLLEMLLEIWDRDPNQENPIVQEAAYEALFYAAGKTSRDLTKMEEEGRLDLSVIDKARQMVEKLK